MLIFDSGVGGLVVLTTIKKILPNIHYIYILDNESFPYGKKTDLFLIQRSIKIINIIKKKYPISIVVIACNTVSTIALSVLKKIFNIPIIGIFPAIKDAEKITKNKIIGLIATRATINSLYTKKMIYKRSFCNVIKIIGTNKLAVIAEKKVRGIKFSQVELKKIFKSWINLSVQPDTIILGCTHFSLLEEEIKTVLYTPSINFIDSVTTVISHIIYYFNKLNINQHIKQNIFFYSKKTQELKSLLYFLKQYKFKSIKHINLN